MGTRSPFLPVPGRSRRLRRPPWASYTATVNRNLIYYPMIVLVAMTLATNAYLLRVKCARIAPAA